MATWTFTDNKVFNVIETSEYIYDIFKNCLYKETIYDGDDPLLIIKIFVKTMSRYNDICRNTQDFHGILYTIQHYLPLMLQGLLEISKIHKLANLLSGREDNLRKCITKVAEIYFDVIDGFITYPEFDTSLVEFETSVNAIIDNISNVVFK